MRPATEEDCETIGAEMKVVVEEGRWLATEEAGTEELAERHRAALAAGERLYVLEDEGEVVGCLGLYRRLAGVEHLGMWVLPTHRGRGGGRMLMEAAIAERPPDVHKLELEVWPENEVAVGLYRSIGFEEEGLRRSHYRRRDGSLRSALIMARLFVDED